jgi:hypothetical protein
MQNKIKLHYSFAKMLTVKLALVAIKLYWKKKKKDLNCHHNHHDTIYENDNKGGT